MSEESEDTFHYAGIAEFKAVCKSCRAEFRHPMLGDMLGYGEFIATSERGNLYAYVSAFTGEWDEITRILNESVGRTEAEDPRGIRLQWVIGRCLDLRDGQRLSIGAGPVCPACQSHSISYGDGERLGFAKVPDAKWTRFKSMSESEKRRFIAILWEASKPSGKS